MATSSSSCWKVVPFVESYCCDILEDKNMSGVRYETKVDGPCIQCLVIREELRGIICAANQNMAGTLSGCEV